MSVVTVVGVTVLALVVGVMDWLIYSEDYSENYSEACQDTRSAAEDDLG